MDLILSFLASFALPWPSLVRIDDPRTPLWHFSAPRSPTCLNPDYQLHNSDYYYYSNFTFDLPKVVLEILWCMTFFQNFFVDQFFFSEDVLALSFLVLVHHLFKLALNHLLVLLLLNFVVLLEVWFFDFFLLLNIVLVLLKLFKEINFFMRLLSLLEINLLRVTMTITVNFILVWKVFFILFILRCLLVIFIFHYYNTI